MKLSFCIVGAIFAATTLASPAQSAPSATKPLTARRAYMPELSPILANAVARLTPGASSNGARSALALALAKNGEFDLAKPLIEALTDASSRARNWSLAALSQSRLSDEAGAKTSFERAKTDAKLIRSSDYDRDAEMGRIARDQAKSGDLDGALQTVAQSGGKREVLQYVARVAARDGDFKPAIQLLKLSQTPEEISEANGLICIGHAVAYNWDAALAALEKTTLPQHKIPALLALHDNQKLADKQADTFLPQALALVPQIPSTGEIDLSGVVKNADYGAIALAQIETSDRTIDLATAIQRSLKTLQLVQPPEEASLFTRRICADICNRDLPSALEIADAQNDQMKARLLCDIASEVAKQWADADATEKPALADSIVSLVTQAIDIANAMDEGSTQEWTRVYIAEPMARANNYDAARKYLAQDDTVRPQIIGHANLVIVALNAKNTEQLATSLQLMETLAQTAPDSNESGMHIGAGASHILDRLQDPESQAEFNDDFAIAAAGLN